MSTNAARQPNWTISHAAMAGVIIAPMADPLWNSPTALARSFAGNHSAQTLVPAG